MNQQLKAKFWVNKTFDHGIKEMFWKKRTNKKHKKDHCREKRKSRNSFNIKGKKTKTKTNT